MLWSVYNYIVCLGKLCCSYSIICTLSLFIWNYYIGNSDIYALLVSSHEEKFIKCFTCTFSSAINEYPTCKVGDTFKCSSVLTWFDSLKKHLYTAVFLNLDNRLPFRNAVCCRTYAGSYCHNSSNTRSLDKSDVTSFSFFSV